MATINKVMIMGNLTRDPELRYTPGGAPVGEFALALNERYKNKQTGQDTEKVHFIDIVCWGKTAEIAAQFLKKGSPVHIEGKLTQDRWEDQASGQKRSKLKVTCERLTFVGSKNDGGAGGGGNASEGVGQDQAPVDDVPF
jgi:single-strand DNA-binding protein